MMWTTMKSVRRSTLLSAIAFICLFLIYSQPAFASVTADFTANSRKGEAPLSPTFTDQSLGTITGWIWSFPGGSPSSATGQGPHTVTYSDPGNYDVTLIVIGPVTQLPVPKDTLTKYNYIEVYEPEPELDYGDAPDDGTGRYPTLKANNGACHIIDGSTWLGSSVDADEDGQPDEHALGDDENDDSDDEDGIEIPTLVPGDSAEIKIITHGAGYLSAWIDFNGDMDWDDLNEHVLDAVPLSGGTNTRTILTPENADTGFTVSRWRYSADPVYEAEGMIASGEVEDFIVDVQAILNGSSELDSLALVALYNSTDGPNWTDNTNWLNGRMRTWYGISGGSRVDWISLNDNNLNGYLPPEIGDLALMRGLQLARNHLTGFLPPELGNLHSLTDLYLYENEIRGSIPPELGNLSNLERLSLANNILSGPIPPELGNLTRLTDLSLANNIILISPIPPELGNLPSLRYLSLSNNSLIGPIPPELGNIITLISLGLGKNTLNGHIPAELGNLVNLNYLNISHNNIDGSIPPELGNLVNLTTLYLNFNSLSGSLPAEIGNMTRLQQIIVGHNNLTGPVPASLENLTDLTNLCIHYNEFTDLPHLSHLNLHELAIAFNKFDFGDIEPYMNMVSLNCLYWPQDSVETEKQATATNGSSLALTVSVGGTANHYHWFKDGSPAYGAPDSSTYLINPVRAADSGTYTCEIMSEIVPYLILYRRPLHVTVIGSGTSIEDEDRKIPVGFSLKQNHPNPFNPETEIGFDLPESKHVILKIYDILGSEVRTLVNEAYAAGTYQIHWDGRDNSGNMMSSNVYICHLKAGHYHAIRKMLFMR